MAIIRCPECEENISSTVQQCVHCGAKIRFCPECESVFAGDIANCPNCGYVFEKASQASATQTSVPPKNDPEDPENLSRANITTIKTTWFLEKPMRQYLSKIISVILNVIVAISSAIAIFLYYKCTKSILSFKWELDMQILAAQTLQKITPLLICAMVAYIIEAVIKRMLGMWSLSDFSVWIKQKKLTFDGILKNSYNEDTHGETEQAKTEKSKVQNFVINAKLFAENSAHRSRTIAYQTLQSVMDGMTRFFPFLWMILNAEVLMNWTIEKRLWEIGYHNQPFGDLKFSIMENNWMLVVTGVLMVIDFIISYISDFNEQKRYKKFESQYKASVDEI